MQTRMTIVVLIISLAGCGVRYPIALTSRSEIQSEARITIPPTATGLKCRYQRGIDPLIRGRFEIPAADLPVVLGGMPKSVSITPFAGTSHVVGMPVKEPWWQPTKLAKPRVVKWSEPGFAYNLMFGDSGKPGQRTVYFCNFGM